MYSLFPTIYIFLFHTLFAKLKKPLFFFWKRKEIYIKYIYMHVFRLMFNESNTNICNQRVGNSQKLLFSKDLFLSISKLQHTALFCGLRCAACISSSRFWLVFKCLLKIKLYRSSGGNLALVQNQCNYRTLLNVLLNLSHTWWPEF